MVTIHKFQNIELYNYYLSGINVYLTNPDGDNVAIDYDSSNVTEPWRLDVFDVVESESTETGSTAAAANAATNEAATTAPPTTGANLIL